MYSPTIPPTDPAAIPAYLATELQALAQSLQQAVPYAYLQTLNVAPSRPREGLLAKADGTKWNPGSGAGVYVYKAGAWSALGGGGGGGGTYTRGACWDGAGTTIVAGSSLADVSITCSKAGTINSAIILTHGGTGSCVIDVWKAPYASYPPTVANAITASSLPTISSGVDYKDTTLTGWTTSVSAGDVLTFHVNSCSVFTYIEILLELA